MNSNPILNCKPLLTDVNNLLWEEPRNATDRLIPNMSDPEIKQHYGVDYLIGMVPSESAFICGLLRARKPKKILEVGVNQGGGRSSFSRRWTCLTWMLTCILLIF